MTRKNKVLMIGGILLVGTIILTIFMPTTYSVTVNNKLEVPKNMTYNAVSDFYTLPLWYHKFENDTVSYHANLFNSSLLENEIKYNEGIIRRISSSENDSLLMYDENHNKKTLKIKFKFSDQSSTQTSLEIMATGQSGLVTNLLNFWHKWRLKRQIKEDVKKLIILLENRVSQNVYHGYEIKSVSMPDKYYITRKDVILKENLVDFYKQNVALLYQSALNDNLAINGLPVLLKYQVDINDQYEVAVGLPTLSEVLLKYSSNQVFASSLAYQIVHEGQSMSTQKAHRAMRTFFKDREMEYLMPIVEEYPAEILEDTSLLGRITHVIYYPKQ